jgi:hypothetical protein
MSGQNSEESFMEILPNLPKPRADAKLKTLPEERQREIAEFADKRTLAETVAWLGTSGVEVSSCALSRFLGWHRLKEQMGRNEVVVEELLATQAERRPELTEERVSALGQMFFCELALEQRDAKAWSLAQRTAIRRAEVQLAFQKYRDACALAQAEIAKLKDPDRKLSEKETLAIVDRLDRILGFK